MVGKGALFTVMVLWISNAPQITENKPIPRYYNIDWITQQWEIWGFLFSNLTSVLSVNIQDLKSTLPSQ